MMFTAGDMKNIYEKLDKITPLDFDCGKLCGDVCCVYDNDDFSNEDLVIYLLPGEELILEDNDYFKVYYVNARNIGYSDSWIDKLYLVKCSNPPHCDRKYRPIQCRTFPLTPHISLDDEFHLVYDESEIPYICPIIKEKLELNDEFVKGTYEVWKTLIKNPVIFNLVKTDSRRRNTKKVEYEIII